MMGAGTEGNGASGFVLVVYNGPNRESYCPFAVSECRGGSTVNNVFLTNIEILLILLVLNFYSSLCDKWGFVVERILVCKHI
jgi:hypothetical protein